MTSSATSEDLEYVRDGWPATVVVTVNAYLSPKNRASVRRKALVMLLAPDV